MKKPKISIDNIEQEIDLSEFINFDFSDERALKEMIGQALVDKIVARTESGTAYGGRKLKSPYSKSYVDSLQFKAAGKKKTKVNMELTGDMLASVNIKSGDKSKIKLTVAEDQCPKAFNHITGDTVPRRNWFGVTQGEVKDILRQFMPEIEAAAKEPGALDQAGDNPERISLIDLFGDGDDE